MPFADRVGAAPHGRTPWAAEVLLYIGTLLCLGFPLSAAAGQAPEHAAASAAGRGTSESEYVVGPKDVLAINVWNQPGLSGKFSVESDGMFPFPLLGRVNAAGLTPRGIATELSKQLADGFFTDPQISVTVDEFRSQRIFLVGEVREPGPYPLSGPTTMVELLALAKSTTPGASKEAILVRPAGGNRSAGPILPGETTDAQILRIDLDALETGNLTNNVLLRDGDTIFVPRAATVVVFGQVKNPGVYPVGSDTSLVHVLALAGGLTDRGAANRVRIIRTAGPVKKELKARLSDLVQAGDTIIIPERLF